MPKKKQAPATSRPIRVPLSFFRSINAAVKKINESPSSKAINLEYDRMKVFKQLEKHIPLVVRRVTGKHKKKSRPIANTVEAVVVGTGEMNA